MRRKIKAFTRIELLVLISIIVVLLLVLMPALGNTRDQSRRILCASNLKTMGMGDIMYSQESDNWHVPILNGSVPENWLWFQNPLFNTLVDMKGRHNAENQDILEAEAIAWTPQIKDFNCPNDKRTVENGGLFVEGGIAKGSSYAMNQHGIQGIGRSWYTYPWKGGPGLAHCLKTSQVVKPDEKIFFMDGQWFAVCMYGADYKRIWDVIGDRMGAMEWNVASYRHDEGANIAFYDAHVKWLPKEEIYPYRQTLPEQMEALKALWWPVPDKDFLDPP